MCTRGVMKITAILCCIPIAAAFTSPRATAGSTRAVALLMSDGVTSSTPFSIGGPSDELLDLFNSQVTNEFYASQLYLSASIWFDQRDWEGFSSYMLAESAEERGHALQFVDFANKRNIPLKLQGIPAPNSEWANPEEVWNDILELERGNTRSMLLLAEAANRCQDFGVLAFLNPFHMEQIDSESNISTILAKVIDEKQTPGLLRQLDHELGLEAGAGGGGKAL